MRLLQQFGQARTAVQQALGRSVEVGTEFREGGHLTILGEFTLHRAGNLFHRFRLGGRAHTRHRQTDVHGRADTLVEQVRLKEDLAVGDGDHVRRNIGRHVVSLGFNDRQGRQRTVAIVIVQLRSALQKARVQVEHVTRIGFAAWWAAQQQGHLTISNSLLGKVIIDDQGVHAVVTEPFAHGAAGERCKVLQRGRLGCGSGHDDRVVEGAALFERLDDLGHRGTLLADGDVDTEQLLAVVLGRVVGGLLVQDGVDADRGLAGLTVTNDQLALAAADRDHAVDGFQARHHRLVNRLTRDDARRFHVHALAGSNVFEGALAVDRVTKRIHDAAQQALADRSRHDFVEALDGVAFFNVAVVTEDHDADIVAFQVQGHALDAAVELDHFAGLNAVQTVDTGDTVAH